MTRALGLDFGTTNTVLAMRTGGQAAGAQGTGAQGASEFEAGGSAADGHKRAETVAPLAFTFADTHPTALRSALCFWRPDGKPPGSVAVEIGPWAIKTYIEGPDECRFVQSLKTFAASPHFTGTYLFGKRFRFEDLMRVFFERVRAHGTQALATLPERLVIGRPVTFAGASPDAALAMERYRAALSAFGFSEILFVYEPVAAAFYFARTLERSANVLVADFGGGTTDFSVMRFQVGGGTFRAAPLAHGGVGIAGDAFDYRIIDQVILPHLGKGSRFRGMGKVLEFPMAPFANFARWNLLSVMKGSDEFKSLKDMIRVSLEPEKLQRFVDLVEDDQGYPLYKAVSDAKAQLSAAESAPLRFAPLGRDFCVEIRRDEFESWIADDLHRMEAALDRTLSAAHLMDTAIDKVFLTGGTSFVPAVRRIFERRFGSERIESGDELLSIANGLALIGERDDAAAWAIDPAEILAAEVEQARA